MADILSQMVEHHGMEMLGMLTDVNEAKRQLHDIGFDDDARRLQSNEYAAKLFSDLVRLNFPDGEVKDESAEKIESIGRDVIAQLKLRPNLLGEIFVMEGYIESLINTRNIMIAVVIGEKLFPKRTD
jgi:hypothetical protein